MSEADIIARLDRIEALLQGGQVAPALPLLSVRTEDAMKMLGCKSSSAFQRECKTISLKPYSWGKYRVKDIENALAKKSYEARRSK